MVTTALKKACNLDQLIVLERLQQELTQHVYMMTTFLASDHVLVGRLDARVDPLNAELLDRNAQRQATELADEHHLGKRSAATAAF